MTNQTLNRKHALAWRVAFTLILAAAAVYLLAAHWHSVTASVQAARHAHGSWLMFALLCLVLTFCLAAASYRVLALHAVRYPEVLLIQLAASFAGRLLPAGLGGLGLNGVYLYRRKHTPAEATAIVSVNNLLGMLAHLLLLAGVLITQPHTVQTLFTRRHIHISWMLLAAASLGAVLITAVPAVRRRGLAFIRNLLASLRKERLPTIALALLIAGLVTATYTLLLFSAARSVGLALPLLPVFIVFSVGMLVGTATPTPGGLVGAEAGLLAGFLAYGAAAPAAGAAVLLFRLMTYWLPLLPGAAALVAVRSRHIL